MSRKVPRAAFCEEYDEDSHVTRPETRKVANAASKRSATDLRSLVGPLLDGASDSGYSSRTAATVNSAQSGPSGGGRRSPVRKPDPTPTLKKAGPERARSTRKERGERPVREEKMAAGREESVGRERQAQSRRSSSKRRRDSVQIGQTHETCWNCEHGLHQPPGLPEGMPMEYAYYLSQPQPPLPQNPRYPPSMSQDVYASHTRPGRSGRSENRPVSFHGFMPGMDEMMYNPPMNPYEHGPPLSSSAYTNAFPYPPQYPQHSYYPMDFIPQESPRARSASRTRDSTRSRRPSVYGPPMLDYNPAAYYDEGPDQRPSRESRSRKTSQPSQQSYDPDEDYYRMPPPPKPKPAPPTVQKRPDPPRKSATTTAVHTERRHSRTFDMSDMEAALPGHYRRPSRETNTRERSRSRSLRDGRRNSLHHDPPPSRVPADTTRRRRSSVYDVLGGDMEEKQREAEAYQAARSGKAAPVPLTADALSKTKPTRVCSDSGSISASQKSRSNSTGGSEGRTKGGDGEDRNIVMTMNGLTMSFNQEYVGGKRISLRTGDTGGVELNIAGKRGGKKYVTGPRSEHAASSGRKELEDSTREEPPRSDRASRRSSRSTYNRLE